MMFLRALGAIFALFLSGAGVNAATLTVNGNVVTGATGIIEGGSSYDVALIDGRCDALFSGCNEDADFAPLVQADLITVQNVLTTFFNEINTNPSFDKSNIFGCGDPFNCTAYTPVYFNEANSTVQTALVNWGGTNIGAGVQGFSEADIGAPDNIADWTNFDTLVWASVSGSINPVPLPTAFPLFAGGLALLGLIGWRRKRKTAAA